MAKIRLTSPTFDASAQTIVHPSFSDVGLGGIQLITNVTDGIIIYNFADSAKGGTLATDTLTLEYDTTSMSDSDDLMILVEDGTTTQTVSATDLDIRNLTNTDVVTAELSATDNAVLDAIAASVAAIDTDTTTIIGHVDGIETAIGTTNTTLTTIDGRVDGLETLATSTNTKLDTVIGHVDGVEALLTTIDADTGSILTSVDGIEALLTTIDSDTGAMVTDLAAIEVLLTTIQGDTTDIETAVELLDDPIFADDAAVTLGTSKGGLLAGVAVNMDGTDPTAVSAEGDAALLRTDPNRILLVQQTHPRYWHVSADYASAQTNVSVKAAPGASLSLYITDIVISNGATAGNITLLDGSGGTVLFEIYPAINGGATISLRNPIKLTANTALCLTSTTVTTHSVFISGYIAA